MSWAPELNELRQRLELAAGLGGPEGIERQHSRGKLTATERLDLLLDAGSMERFGTLRGEGTYNEDGTLKHFLPAGSIDAMGRIDGRRVVVTAGDFTVRGGSGGGSSGGLGTEMSATQRALAWRLPLVRLLDSGGGSVRSFETYGRTYLPDANSFTRHDVDLLSQSPVVSAVLGAAAGIAALHTSLAHWNVMIPTNAQVFPGGPPVVRAALGQEISKEELGGPQVHVFRSGVVDNLAVDEADAMRQIRQQLPPLVPRVAQ